MMNAIKGLGGALLAMSLFACSGEVDGDDGTKTGHALEGQKTGSGDTGNGGGQDTGSGGGQDTGNGGGQDTGSGGGQDTGSGGGKDTGSAGTDPGTKNGG